MTSVTGICFPDRSRARSTTYLTPPQHGTSILATVMDRIAKGFTHDEAVAIAAWWAAQK